MKTFIFFLSIALLSLGIQSCNQEKKISELASPFSIQDTLFHYTIDSSNIHIFQNKNSTFNTWIIELSIEKFNEGVYFYRSPQEGPVTFRNGKLSIPLNKKIPDTLLHVGFWATPKNYIVIDTTTNSIEEFHGKQRYFNSEPGVLNLSPQIRKQFVNSYIINDSVYKNATQEGYLKIKN